MSFSDGGGPREGEVLEEDVGAADAIGVDATVESVRPDIVASLHDRWS